MKTCFWQKNEKKKPKMLTKNNENAAKMTIIKKNELSLLNNYYDEYM